MIEELLHWQDPSASNPDVEYTDDEQLTMLNLPRKECGFHHIASPPSYMKLKTSESRHCFRIRHTPPLSNFTLHPVRLRLRHTHYNARPDTRKRVDTLHAYPRFLRSRPPTLCVFSFCHCTRTFQSRRNLRRSCSVL
jgi:hypothetical protein